MKHKYTVIISILSLIAAGLLIVFIVACNSGAVKETVEVTTESTTTTEEPTTPEETTVTTPANTTTSSQTTTTTKTTQPTYDISSMIAELSPETEPTTTSTTPEVTTVPSEATTTTTPAPTQATTAAQPSNKPADAQGMGDEGYYYKYEGSIKYQWEYGPLGWQWINISTVGEVIEMQVKSAGLEGYQFYQNPDTGAYNLDKVVTPDGKIISYEEYEKIIAEQG